MNRAAEKGAGVHCLKDPRPRDLMTPNASRYRGPHIAELAVIFQSKFPDRKFLLPQDL